MRLSARGISKTYRDASQELRVLEGVSYEFPSGRSVGIVGRSGIGKSTLLHLLGGLERPSSGEVWYDDVSLSSFDDEGLTAFRGTNVGFVFQFHHLLPEFSAIENVAMPLIISGVEEEKCRERAKSLLDRVGLGHRLEHRPGKLSGGEQQRVAIARAMVASPKVILADEPTGNLDVVTGREVQKALLDLQREAGSTLLVVTHSLELARSLDLAVEMAPGGGLTDLTAP